MSEKVFHCNISREQGFLYFIDKNNNVARCSRGCSRQEVVCKTDFVKEKNWLYYVDKNGDVSRSRMRSGFREYVDVRDDIMLGEEVFLHGD